MKQFLTPTPKQTYTIAKDFTFLLYPFNLAWREDDDTNPFKGIYYESLYGKIDKKGEFKVKMDLVHGPTNEVYEHNGYSYGSDKERMSLMECFILVDSAAEKNSKFVKAFTGQKSDWIFGNAPKDITYSIFKDFYNNSKNETYTIVSPKPRGYEAYKKESFGEVITKEELSEVIKFYQSSCDEFVKNETHKFNQLNSLYKPRFDKKADGYIPFEYTLPSGTQFKFIKFGVKYGRNSKKKDFVELQINGKQVFIKEEDFSGIWVE